MSSLVSMGQTLSWMPEKLCSIQEGEGLGASGSGIAAPVSAVGATARTSLGLGAKDHTDPSTAADDFDLCVS